MGKEGQIWVAVFDKKKEKGERRKVVQEKQVKKKKNILSAQLNWGGSFERSLKASHGGKASMKKENAAFQ